MTALTITTQAQYDEVKSITDTINSRGSRFRELQNRSLGYGDALNQCEEAEWQLMLADYTEKCDALAAYNATTMARVVGSLA